MVVAVVADVLGKENNGTTIACMNLIRYLKSKGDTVRIVCCDEDKKNEENYFVVPCLNLGALLNRILEKNEVKVAKKDEKILCQALEGVDVCHIMTPFFLGCSAARIAKAKNIPVTAGFHCQAENFTGHLHLMNSRPANTIFYKTIYKLLYSKVDKIHYPTQFIKDTFEKVIGKETPGVVVSNGVNDIFINERVEKPDELKHSFVILTIGRLSREKSQKILVKAVAKSRYKDNIQLIIAGGGPLKKQIFRCAEKVKIKRPIINFFSREELVKVINYSDLYCHPAEIEIEAISCLEAITCGLVPVIADSPRSATKSFALDDNNLFRYNDPSSLAQKIDFWIEHPDLKKKYSEKYTGYTRQFDQKDCMERTRNILVGAYEEAKSRLL